MVKIFMGRLADFLNKYNTIIFDMDGVITSEQNYWTCAALTVWEWTHSAALYGDEQLDAKQMLADAAKIRAAVFSRDALIALLKGKGVNSNWDLGYLVFAVSLILNTRDFSEVMRYCESFDDNILNEYDSVADRLDAITGRSCARNEELWYEMVMTFQEWFLGDALFEKRFKRKSRLAGKAGLIHSEQPIIDKEVLDEIFKRLTESGKRLATGTGRPSNELIQPLKSFGIYECFAQDGIINHDHVMNAERILGCNLTKPHPYIFLKALLGESFDDSRIVNGDYDKELVKSALIVGAAGADILAAKAMGADFCAVLTGISGESARGYFEEQKAEYILASLADFLQG